MCGLNNFERTQPLVIEFNGGSFHSFSTRLGFLLANPVWGRISHWQTSDRLHLLS